MEIYESRRSRRLRLEREKRKRNRRKIQQIGLIFLAIFFVVLMILLFSKTENSDEKAETKIPEQKQTRTEKKKEKKPLPSSNIQNNLQAKIDELNGNLGLPKNVFANDLPGNAATSVAIIDLSDKKRGNVDFNGNLQFTSASTYKVFVAYSMIREIETGKRSWLSALGNSTFDICLQRMIVNSDNVCPETYLARAGFSKINAQIHEELGMSDQTQIKVNDMRTTANDLALFFKKFYSGELMSAENQQKLIDLMKKQTFRQGIPAGILAQINNKIENEGTTVADKVGFMNALLSDAGIVYSDKGDYVLVIMTNGESWEFIAQLTAWINQQMNS